MKTERQLELDMALPEIGRVGSPPLKPGNKANQAECIVMELGQADAA